MSNISRRQDLGLGKTANGGSGGSFAAHERSAAAPPPDDAQVPSRGSVDQLHHQLNDINERINQLKLEEGDVLTEYISARAKEIHPEIASLSLEVGEEWDGCLVFDDGMSEADAYDDSGRRIDLTDSQSGELQDLMYSVNLHPDHTRAARWAGKDETYLLDLSDSKSGGLSWQEAQYSAPVPDTLEGINAEISDITAEMMHGGESQRLTERRAELHHARVASIAKAAHPDAAAVEIDPVSGRVAGLLDAGGRPLETAQVRGLRGIGDEYVEIQHSIDNGMNLYRQLSNGNQSMNINVFGSDD